MVLHGPEALLGSVGAPRVVGVCSAAMVGVFVNPALLFAGHVFWPHGLSGGFDTVAALVAPVAAVALWSFRVGVLPLLGAWALLGLSASLAWPALR